MRFSRTEDCLTSLTHANENKAYGRSFAEGLVAQGPEHGVTVVESIPITDDTTNTLEEIGEFLPLFHSIYDMVRGNTLVVGLC